MKVGTDFFLSEGVGRKIPLRSPFGCVLLFVPVSAVNIFVVRHSSEYDGRNRCLRGFRVVSTYHPLVGFSLAVGIGEGTCALLFVHLFLLSIFLL